jgi:hypothetical protein
MPGRDVVGRHAGRMLRHLLDGQDVR